MEKSALPQRPALFFTPHILLYIYIINTNIFPRYMYISINIYIYIYYKCIYIYMKGVELIYCQFCFSLWIAPLRAFGDDLCRQGA